MRYVAACLSALASTWRRLAAFEAPREFWYLFVAVFAGIISVGAAMAVESGP